MKERDVENYLIKKCKEYNILCFKFTSPSNAGVPDRILIGYGYTLFIELKRPGEMPRPLQLEIHKKMRNHGAYVFVIDNKNDIDAIIHHIITKRLPDN